MCVKFLLPVMYCAQMLHSLSLPVTKVVELERQICSPAFRALTWPSSACVVLSFFSSGSCSAMIREISDPYCSPDNTQAGTSCSRLASWLRLCDINFFSERKDVLCRELKWLQEVAEVLDLQMAKFLGDEDLLKQPRWDHLWEHSVSKKLQIKPVVTFITGNKVEVKVSLASTQT